MKTKIAVADFETCGDLCNVRVWLWSLVTDGNEYWGVDINGFFALLMRLDVEKGNKIFFHNLAYDGSYLINYMESIGYTFTEERTPKRKKEYNAFIDDSVGWYNIRFRNNNKQIITICDSLKKIPFTVAQIAKSFKLEDKGSINYTEIKPIGYQPTKKEVEYCLNDSRIVFQAIKIMLEKGGEKLTIGSDCMNYFKSALGGSKRFRKIFPNLDIPFDGWDTSKELYYSIDNFCRKAYAGAFCYVKPQIKNKLLGEGMTLDVNSLYPYVMRTFPYPYGVPQYLQGEPDFDTNYLYIVHVSICFDLKQDGVPCVIERTQRFSNLDTWVGSTNGEYKEFCFTSIDWEMIQDNYIYDVKFIDYLKFKKAPNLFSFYIDKWFDVKEQATNEGNAGMRTLAKLYLNNLYGKFGQGIKFQSKKTVSNNGVLFFENIVNSGGESCYVPVAAFCTAYARRVTITACKANFNRFCYADTDSLHLQGLEPPTGVEIHPTKLGAWAVEGEYTKSKYVRQKTYVEEMTGKNRFINHTTKTTDFYFTDVDMIALCDYVYKDSWLNVTCAGFKKMIWCEKDKQMYTRNEYYEDVLGLGFDDFKEGLIIPEGKTQRKQVNGGCKIYNSDFTMRSVGLTTRKK